MAIPYESPSTAILLPLQSLQSSSLKAGTLFQALYQPDDTWALQIDSKVDYFASSLHGLHLAVVDRRLSWTAERFAWLFVPAPHGGGWWLVDAQTWSFYWHVPPVASPGTVVTVTTNPAQATVFRVDKTGPTGSWVSFSPVQRMVSLRDRS